MNLVQPFLPYFHKIHSPIYDLGVPSGLFSSGFRLKFVRISYRSRACYMANHLILLHLILLINISSKYAFHKLGPLPCSESNNSEIVLFS